ncbi:MAG: hypothetical protein R3296_07200 [Oleiphilaceae bacterium]|nr:hypothetical protein [Oleiphilaceae bacterium]
MAADLSSLAPWLKRVAPLLYRRYSLEPSSRELGHWLSRHPKLVLVLNHGPALGPLPALTALGQALLEAGGAGRVPFSLDGGRFSALPLAGESTRESGERRLEEALKRLRHGPWTDCWVMPEGELANLGNGVDVQPFRCSGFVELAVRAGVPLLLVAHQGSEKLGRCVEVPESLLGLGRWLPHHLSQPLSRQRQLSVPWLFSGRVKQLRLSCELYQPQLSLSELEGPGGPRALGLEAQQVRSRLQRRVNQLVLEAEGH